MCLFVNQYCLFVYQAILLEVLRLGSANVVPRGENKLTMRIVIHVYDMVAVWDECECEQMRKSVSIQRSLPIPPLFHSLP